MLLKSLSAIIFPFLLVVLFARVTYSVAVATVLTLALIAASIYKGFAEYTIVIILDFVSIIAGVWYAKNMVKRNRPK